MKNCYKSMSNYFLSGIEEETLDFLTDGGSPSF
jgi:hypothetical protein